MALSEWFKIPDKTVTSISLDINGLTVTRQASSVLEQDVLRWDEVALVLAYLKDCLTIDQARVEVLLIDGRGFVFTEDHAGFESLVDSLAKHLPGIPDDWHLRLVTSPAFDPTIHTLFKRVS